MGGTPGKIKEPKNQRTEEPKDRRTKVFSVAFEASVHLAGNSAKHAAGRQRDSAQVTVGCDRKIKRRKKMGAEKFIFEAQ